MANLDLAVEVKDLHKSFKLPHEQHSGIKQRIINTFKGVKGYETQHVLKDISLEIKKGEFFGIVGRNGSGKSTLLKLLAGIYVPDKGLVQVNGSLTPFIELGVGFNPELTGRENVFLNGALLGFSRPEVETMYDDIVGFAELKKFMDQKLKNYSSGMQVRLAFSIAIRARGDILLLDEVLAVGDEAFQKKCYSYFDQLKRDKKTVILVTHDMGAVERFCNRAMFIEGGIVKQMGQPHIIAAAYSRSNDASYSESQTTKVNDGNKEQSQIDIEILDKDNQPAHNFGHGDVMNVKLSWSHDNVYSCGIAIFRENGEYVFGPNTYQDKYELPAGNSLTYEVELNLNEGNYFVKAGLNGQNDKDRIAFVEEGPHFTVTKDYDNGRWGGVTRLNYKWR